MATTFSIPINHVRTTLGSGHTIGSGTLALASGGGALFGSTFPLRATAITAASYGTNAEVSTIFTVGGRSTDTLTSCAAIEGTADQAFGIGDVIEMRPTAGSFSDIHAAVNNLEADGPIWQALGPGTAVANTTALLSSPTSSIFQGVSPTVGSLTVPPITVAGKYLTFGLSGTCGVTGTPTLQVAIYLGSTQVFSTTALTTSAGTGVAWTMESGKGGLMFQVLGSGTAGKVYGMTQFNSGIGVNANMPSGGTGTAAPVQVNIDTTISNVFDVRFQWGTANAANTIQLKGGWLRLDG